MHLSETSFLRGFAVILSSLSRKEVKLNNRLNVFAKTKQSLLVISELASYGLSSQALPANLTPLIDNTPLQDY